MLIHVHPENPQPRAIRTIVDTLREGGIIIYPTDTILPYSLYKEADEDYHGRIERIDSYDKQKDIFVSMQLIPRKNWDSEAEELFRFNRFIESRKKK